MDSVITFMVFYFLKKFNLFERQEKTQREIESE